MGELGVIIVSNLNRVRLSCCWVGVGLACDNIIETRAVLESSRESLLNRNSLEKAGSALGCAKKTRFVEDP